MSASKIVGVEWAYLEGKRPRPIGCNARLGWHGDMVRVPIVRLTTDDGTAGFGLCRAAPEQMTTILGVSLEALFSLDAGVSEPWMGFEYPIWDLMGRRTGQPVYALLGCSLERLFAPCYDTSLYFDDLHLRSDQEAADLIAEEARTGYALGHRAFKIKIGRGARHLPLREGTARDIAIIQTVREAVGPEVTLMIDANNGFNLNLTKEVLAETAACKIFWLEEAFHEDPVLYRELRTWLEDRNLPVLIADGEGDASTHLLAWAQSGLIDVIQYDIVDYGFTRWLHLGRQLDAWGVRSAPHHYGSHYGNYASCHLAGVIQNFLFVEWDEVTTPGLDGSGYILKDGFIEVPNSPGFGLTLGEEIFRQAVQQAGGSSWL